MYGKLNEFIVAIVSESTLDLKANFMDFHVGPILAFSAKNVRPKCYFGKSVRCVGVHEIQ